MFQYAKLFKILAPRNGHARLSPTPS